MIGWSLTQHHDEATLMTPMGGGNHTIDTVKKLDLDLDEILVTEVNLFLFR